ncbi:unnamed protein product, partial [Bubo scandiacus]
MRFLLALCLGSVALATASQSPLQRRVVKEVLEYFHGRSNVHFLFKEQAVEGAVEREDASGDVCPAAGQPGADGLQEEGNRSGTTAGPWRTGENPPAWPATSLTAAMSPRCWTSTRTAAPAITWRRSSSETRWSAGRWRRPAGRRTRSTCPACSPSPGGCQP